MATAFAGSYLFVGLAFAGGNAAPIASAGAQPQEPVVGETTSFSSSGSMDPDAGPSPLTFAWDFGDGQLSALPNPDHTYAAVGAYTATLTVSDGLAQSVATVRTVALPPPTMTRPTSSGSLALSSDDATLAVANADSNSLTLVHTNSLSAFEFAVCPDPRGVAWGGFDNRVFVTCHGSDEVWAVAESNGAMLEAAPTGSQPVGVVVAPATGSVIVANYGGSSVDVFDDELGGSARITVDAGPRALAVSADGEELLVAHFLTTGDAGLVTMIDLGTLAVTRVVRLDEDPGPDTPTSGRGVPNVLATIAIDPAGIDAWVGAIKTNTGRGLFVDGLEVNPRNRVRGLLAPFAVETGSERLADRIDTNAADGVSGVAFSPRGRYVYLTHQGAAQLSVYDVMAAALVDTSDGTAIDFDARVDTGEAPDGVVVAANGVRAYVSNSLSRSVTVYDLSDLSAPTQLESVAVTAEPLDETVALGKRLFFSSRAPVHSTENYIACGSCHPDGGQDGRTWDFTQFGEGLRNTIDLRGRAGMGHGPVHWTANFNEIQDFENDIQNGFGGAGLLGGGSPHPPLAEEPNAGRSDDLDALAGYVASLETLPPSPFREADGSLGPAARRGLAIFFSVEAQCDDCHAPPNFTDSRLTVNPGAFTRHLVGTESEGTGMALGQPFAGLDTPTVLGVWATPPYLHDGSAATLLDVLTTRNLDDRHGKTSHLSPAELDCLVAYMLALQGSADEYPDEPPGGSESTGGGSSSSEGTTSSATSTTSSSGSGPDLPATTVATTDAVATDPSATDGSSEADDGGCGCGSEPPVRSLGTLLVLLALIGRRRRMTAI